jgi:hypothetical protein
MHKGGRRCNCICPPCKHIFCILTNRISGVEPSWSLPRLPEIHQLGFKQRGWSSHEISCHIQEVDATSLTLTSSSTSSLQIPENGADTAHLDGLHKPFMITWLQVMVVCVCVCVCVCACGCLCVCVCVRACVCV